MMHNQSKQPDGYAADCLGRLAARGNMEYFGFTKSWKRIVWPVISIGLTVLPFTVFLIYMSFDNPNIQRALFTVLMLFTLWFIALRHLHTVYSFPLIQIDQNFLVVCEPLSKRGVYNLNRISNPKRFLKSIYFAHNGWPVIINLHSLSEAEKEEVWVLIRGI